MAERPLFVPVTSGNKLVNEVFLALHWTSGFATAQRSKNIRGLHEAASAAGYRNVLEVSSKSPDPFGQSLSAFNLRVDKIPLECAYQGSKVFARGGPFPDLFLAEPSRAKRDPRLLNSGPLTKFQLNEVAFPLEPKTAFYDWLYISSIPPGTSLVDYDSFTDIEFNPARSINCQARSLALYISLSARGLLREALHTPQSFVDTLMRFDYRPHLRSNATPSS
jgi:hypothetical protein